MPKPGGRGGKRSHKGQKRHFTSEDEIRQQQAKEEKEKAWRKQRGIESDESDEEEEEKGASRKPASSGAPGELPPSSSEEESSDEEGPEKPKGVEHLIEVQNPNRMAGKQNKKISELSEEGTAQLSRREREELQKQQAAARYRKLHAEGKTEEAQSDLARLALVRKQREEAARRREEELKAKAAKDAQKKAANK